MAPEVLAGTGFTSKADMWSTGKRGASYIGRDRQDRQADGLGDFRQANRWTDGSTERERERDRRTNRPTDGEDRRYVNRSKCRHRQTRRIYRSTVVDRLARIGIQRQH